MTQPSDATTCCAVILSGGRNTRMSGRNKAFLMVGGVAIVDRLITTLRPIFNEILLVTREPELYRDRPVRIVEDLFPARASLIGIHAGLLHAVTAYAFVIPCDAPFLQPALVRTMVAQIEPSVDVIIPVINGYYEPLCAIYSKRCLALIEAQIKRGDFKITRFFDLVRIKPLSLETIRKVDARLSSFLNVNTPEALKASRDMERQGPGEDPVSA